MSERDHPSQISYQMKGLGRVLETQQHVREHAQRPLSHDGVPQATEYLQVKINRFFSIKI